MYELECEGKVEKGGVGIYGEGKQEVSRKERDSV